MVGIVIPRARHTAKIRAKSLIGQKKTTVILSQLCSETAVFTVLLYCLLDYCKHFNAQIAVERKQSLANLLHIDMNDVRFEH
jgi:hypothetical protein